MLVHFELMRKIKAILTQLCSYSHVQWKIEFGWVDHERLVKISGRSLTFDDKGLSYIPKASDMPMTPQKIVFNHT